MSSTKDYRARCSSCGVSVKVKSSEAGYYAPCHLCGLWCALEKIEPASRPRAESERYTCPRCGRASSNPNDKANRYCGACHEFEDVDGPFIPPRSSEGE